MQDSKNNCHGSLFKAFDTFLVSFIPPRRVLSSSLFFLGESVFHKSALGELEGKV